MRREFKRDPEDVMRRRLAGAAKAGQRPPAVIEGASSESRAMALLALDTADGDQQDARRAVAREIALAALGRDVVLSAHECDAECRKSAHGADKARRDELLDMLRLQVKPGD